MDAAVRSLVNERERDSDADTARVTRPTWPNVANRMCLMNDRFPPRPAPGARQPAEPWIVRSVTVRWPFCPTVYSPGVGNGR